MKGIKTNKKTQMQELDARAVHSVQVPWSVVDERPNPSPSQLDEYKCSVLLFLSEVRHTEIAEYATSRHTVTARLKSGYYTTRDAAKKQIKHTVT